MSVSTIAPVISARLSAATDEIDTLAGALMAIGQGLVIQLIVDPDNAPDTDAILERLQQSSAS